MSQCVGGGGADLRLWLIDSSNDFAATEAGEVGGDSEVKLRIALLISCMAASFPIAAFFSQSCKILETKIIAGESDFELLPP